METIKFIKENYPEIKMCQWFLDRMDTEWINNLSRFNQKFDLKYTDLNLLIASRR